MGDRGGGVRKGSGGGGEGQIEGGVDKVAVEIQ